MTSDVDIPLHKPALWGNELSYLTDAVGARRLSGDGDFTVRCHELLEQTLGVGKVLLTTSCTHALEMAALLLNISEGDEVIVPSYTFVSVVNAFALRGARPLFADIRPDTLNLDEAGLEALITPRTRAIVPVHYAGVASEMDPFCRSQSTTVLLSSRTTPMVSTGSTTAGGSARSVDWRP